MPASDEELRKRFTYHSPAAWQVPYYEQMRERALAFAYEIDAVVPESREKEFAFARLEEVVMWANAAIARRSPRLAVNPAALAEFDGAEEIRQAVARYVPPAEREGES